jgi:Ca2+-binding RTX toxin-like protein
VRTSRPTSQTNRLRSTLEALETRDVASVTSVTLAAGTLRVVGDNAADFVEIRQLNGRIGQTVTVKDKTASPNTTWTFNAAAVQRIVVDLKGGADRLDSTAAKPTQVWGGDGNDYIVTGAGADEIDAGAGDDYVEARGGHDTLYGRHGEDALIGGAGNDRAFGHEGYNVLAGESGNDSLYAGSRADAVIGGEGYDHLEVFSGQSVCTGGESVTIAMPTDQPQTDGWSCGPNSGSRFLRSYGINVSYQTLRSQVAQDFRLSQFHLGTLPTNLRDAIKQHKSDVKLQTGASRADVLEQLGKGKPVIALVAVKKVDIEKLGIKVGTYGLLHYVVLTGYDQATETIRYVDTTGENKTWSYAEFSKRSNWVDYFTGAGNVAQESLRVMGMRNKTIIY